MKKPTYKELEKKNNILFIMFILLTLFFVVFLSTTIVLTIEYERFMEENQELKDKIYGLDKSLGDCVIYPFGVRFNKTKSECISLQYKTIHNVQWCQEDKVCEVLK